jgi:hypothetical protein
MHDIVKIKTLKTQCLLRIYYKLYIFLIDG